MEIKKCEGKENQFILNNKKVTIKKEISEKFYQLIKEKKYDDAFELVDDLNKINIDNFRKPLYILGFGSALGMGLLYLNSVVGVNIFNVLSIITFVTSGGLLVKEITDIVTTFINNQEILKIIDKETKNYDNEELDFENTKSLEKEKINNQTNSFVFDKNKGDDSNIIDFGDFKNKHR